MSDQNTTHSPRVDDQLAHEADALTHGSPDAGRQETLADVAEARSAPPDVVAALRSLPRGRVYETLAEVWSDLGGDVEHRS